MKRTLDQVTTEASGSIDRNDDEDDETAWKDDDFLAFEAPPAENNDDAKNEATEDAGDNNTYDSMDESSSTSSASNHRSSSNSTPPWVLLNKIPSRHHHHQQQPLVVLHNEILQFSKLMEPLESERQQRELLIQELQDSVLEEFGPTAQLLVLGSQATGLFLPTSDIDLTLQYEDDATEATTTTASTKDDSTTYNPLHKKPIHRFGDLIRKKWSSKLSYLETIEATRVPIVKMRFAETNIAVDVSFNQPNGVNAAMLMKEYLNGMPPLRPLTIVLKYFLAARDLNEPYSGGVGSYLLQLLIVSFLQHRERQAFHLDIPLDYNLGALLLDFLELYGLDFNYIVTGLSVRFDGFYFRKPPDSRPNCVSVENPLDVAHDVGSSSYRFNMVQRGFAIAYRTLLAVLTPGPNPDHVPKHSILGSVLPTSSYMTSRLIIKRRDQALSTPRTTANGQGTNANKRRKA